MLAVLAGVVNAAVRLPDKRKARGRSEPLTAITCCLRMIMSGAAAAVQESGDFFERSPAITYSAAFAAASFRRPVSGAPGGGATAPRAGKLFDGRR